MTSKRIHIIATVSALLLIGTPDAPSQNVFSGLKELFSKVKKTKENNKEERKDDSDKIKKAVPKEPEAKTLSSATPFKAVDVYDLDLDENLNTPTIHSNIKDIIKSYQYKEAKKLVNHKQHVELMRNGEVIVITVASDLLFAPNDTVLAATAPEHLRPFIEYLRTPGLYKMVIAMHSDDTGSEEYTYHLTEQRVNAVFDWFADTGTDTSLLIPYSLGASEPLLDNHSRNNRYKNRRLEIFLIPGPAMLQKAKDKTLN